MLDADKAPYRQMPVDNEVPPKHVGWCYDLTSLATESNGIFYFRKNACPFCTMRHPFEHNACVCSPLNRRHWTGDFYCAKEGTHKHYSCPSCHKHWTVELRKEDLTIAGYVQAQPLKNHTL